jgi:hypothetical protein
MPEEYDRSFYNGHFDDPHTIDRGDLHPGCMIGFSIFVLFLIYCIH